MSSVVEPMGRWLNSNLRDDGQLVLSVQEAPVREPADGEILVEIHASPINPSDILTLLAGADLSGAVFGGTQASPSVTAQLSPRAVLGQQKRIGRPMGQGQEGAGVVVRAGKGAESLLGRAVAIFAPLKGLYSQFVMLQAQSCVPLPEGLTPKDGAALFVNPMTALCMVESMRLEGHAGLVHTAAASNLGQMLVRICLEDGIPLVNIVRRPSQVTLLRDLGAQYVCDTSAPTFSDDLGAALEASGSTLAFDAVSGGRLSGQILAAIEKAALRRGAHGLYGSESRKQVYLYGRLDRSPIELAHSAFGPNWMLGGWVMTDVLREVGLERERELQARILAGAKTTFASRFGKTISLGEALQRETMLAFSQNSTGEKFLVDPRG